jgi:hypothetical protein
MIDKIPTFKWNSEEDGKKEFHLFDAALQANLATRQCRFMLDHNAILINTPINPNCWTGPFFGPLVVYITSSELKKKLALSGM